MQKKKGAPPGDDMRTGQYGRWSHLERGQEGRGDVENDGYRQIAQERLLTAIEAPARRDIETKSDDGQDDVDQDRHARSDTILGNAPPPVKNKGMAKK